jgi:hypothetical protein
LGSKAAVETCGMQIISGTDAVRLWMCNSVIGKYNNGFSDIFGIVWQENDKIECQPWVEK